MEIERSINVWLHVFIGSLLFMCSMLMLNRCEKDPTVDDIGRLHGGVVAH